MGKSDNNNAVIGNYLLLLTDSLMNLKDCTNITEADCWHSAPIDLKL